jgi:hypothetical protein
VVLSPPNIENVLIENAINVRAINNSLVRVKYLTDNTLVISHIDSKYDVRAHDVRWGGDIGI